MSEGAENYKDFRLLPHIQHFLPGKTDYEDIPCDDAVKFVKQLIAETNFISQGGVSSTSDCLLLRRTGGTKWM